MRRDPDLTLLVIALSETVRRLEEKVDMLIIQRADEAPDTSLHRDETNHPQT